MRDVDKPRNIILTTVRVDGVMVVEINCRGSHDTFTCATIDEVRTLIADLQSVLGQMQIDHRDQVKRALATLTADELETLAKEKRAREAKARRGR